MERPPTRTPSLPTRPWRTQRTFFVEYRDVDALNHLNHAAYFRYMETLRCDYYLPLIPETDPRKLDIIVAEASCRYLAPAHYADQLMGEVAPAQPLGTTSFSLLYRFLDVERTKVYARGRTVIVCFDYASNGKKPIPSDRKAAMGLDGIDPASEGW
jgi:acyl-CoA thioester hydrolase